MYQRYSKGMNGNAQVASSRKDMAKNVVIFLLFAACVTLSVLYFPQLTTQGDTHTLYIRQIQTECTDAISKTSTLSRNAGADTASALAKIRSNVYSMKKLTEMDYQIEGNGSYIIAPETISSLLSSIDGFLSYLTTGMDTGEYQTDVQNQLDAIQLQLSSLN